MTSKGTNPFLDDEEEVDDFEFLSHPQQGRSGYLLNNDSSDVYQQQDNFGARQRYLVDERRRIEERTLQSTNTSLGLLHESEQVGVATAEELVRQREQLQNVERNLDDISSTMRISQKHINSIKSIFGGIKTFFGKGNTPDPSKTVPVSSVPTRSQSGGLQDTISTLKVTQRDFSDPLHAALRTRGIDYEDEDDTDFGRVVHAERPKPPTVDFEQKLDKNLEDISMGIGRLKSLAIGLNEEIEDQNLMLDRINTKADSADETLTYQNRQIKRILKK